MNRDKYIRILKKKSTQVFNKTKTCEFHISVEQCSQAYVSIDSKTVLEVKKKSECFRLTKSESKCESDRKPLEGSENCFSVTVTNKPDLI